MIDFDIIGTLIDPGEYDAEGEEITPPVTHDGWHVNILTEGLAERPDLEPYVVTPSNLRRVFMGRDADTVALVFDDEATGREVLGIPAPATEGGDPE